MNIRFKFHSHSRGLYIFIIITDRHLNKNSNMYFVFSDRINFFLFNFNIFEKIINIGKIKKMNGNVMNLFQ